MTGFPASLPGKRNLSKVRDVGMPLHAARSRETRPGRSVRCQIGNDRPKQNEPEGEVALMLWLLVMGVNVSRWNEQASTVYEQVSAYKFAITIEGASL